MKNIAIYGGAFDPIHNGHVAIIEELCKINEMDEVWIMPTRVSRWKTDAAPSSLRLKCINKVIENMEKVKLRTDEIESNNKIIYTFDTLNKLHQEYKDVNFYFVIGYDQLKKLDQWYEIDELSKIVTFLVVARPLIELHKENCIKYNCVLLPFSGPNISSTMFKETLDLNLLPKSIHNLLWKEPYYYQEKLKKILSKKRYEHSVSVMNLAKNIAIKHNLDIGLATITGLLHDCAKELDRATEMEIMSKHFNDFKNVSKYLYHQFCGTIIIEQLFNITDNRVKQAILYHTSCNKEMSWLDKLIYSCDKIEPLRGYDSQYMIDACFEDLDKGFTLVLKENIKFLKSTFVTNDFNWTNEAIKYYLKEEF